MRLSVAGRVMALVVWPFASTCTTQDNTSMNGPDPETLGGSAQVSTFPGSFSGTQIEQTTSALTVDGWVGQMSGVDLSEPFAFPVKIGSTWEMMNTVNGTNAGLRLKNEFDYVCHLDPGTFGTWRVGLGDNNNCCDTSGFFQTSSSNAFKAYAASVSSDQAFVRWYKSKDPCPATGTPSWAAGLMGFPAFANGTIDYPYSFYDDAHNNMWFTFNGAISAGGRETLGIALLNANDTGQYWADPCESPDALLFANAAIDSAGDVHVIYLDFPRQEAHTTTFRMASHSWDCSTVAVVGPHQFQPLTNCPSQCSGVATVPNVGTNCIEDGFNASIAIDRTTNMTVASYQTTLSFNPSIVVTKMMRSTDLGAHWQWMAYSNLTSLKPRVTAAFTPTVGSISGLFDIQSTFNVSGSQVAQALWTSTDSGQTWSGQVVTPARNVFALSGFECYWGDYDGATADLAHGSGTSMYFNFEQSGDAFGRWGIQAFTNP